MHCDDPLQDPSYLLPVVQTIACPSSPHIHHLLDAYATFVNRVRSHSHRLQLCDTVPPAFVPLNTHRDGFVQALRRDVRLACLDPFSACSPHPPSLEYADNHLGSGIDARQYARDSSSLCHHALCALTTIFRFPALYFAFPEHHLSILFGDVLDIVLADQLPVLSEAKTYSLSLWALGSHRLPLAVFSSRCDDLVSALQQSLDPATRPSNVILDALKAISHTIERYPAAFFDLLSPLLPRVISNLGCESFEHRTHASIALGKFANALIHQTELSLTKWQSLSDHITSFLESCCHESQPVLSELSFSSMVRAAFSAEPHAHQTHASARILAVLASLIVLCGPPLYEKPNALHLILQSLAMALTHKRSVVRALHPHIWRCFVWTFSQMLLRSEDVRPPLISSAFYVIQQEVSGGIGVALACILLSDRLRTDERDNRLSLVLLVIEAMVRTECKHTRREGFMFLQALTNDARVRQQILRNTHEIPASVLFNGAIIRAEWNSLPSIIHSIPKVPVSVHWPEETEIAQHYKILLVIWKQFASKAERNHSDPCLVDVWLSILLAYSHQPECGEYFAATAEMLRYTATVIVEFLPSVALGDCQPDWGSWSVHDQLCSLTFIDQLWGAMQRAFVLVHLEEAAELILTSVLKLCASLITIASPSFLRDTPDPTTSRLVIRSQRELWGVVATSLASSELSVDWKEIVKFLAVPVCAWVLSEPELEAWEALIRNAITVSGDSAMVIEHVVSQYFKGKEVETWDSIVAVLGFLLTYTLKHRPTDELLSMVDVSLTVCYSRARHSPETLTHSFKLLNVIRRMIVLFPANMMHMLQALRNSLCLWIEDRIEVMSNDEFNSVVASLYCEALKGLELVPLSNQSLHDMEEFLASAFHRTPTPAIAPFAFERFWRATYHGQAQFYSNLPPKIKSCLSCFVAAYGGDLADGLSLTTGSQSQSINNGSQIHYPVGRQHQNVGEFDPETGPLSTSINDETWRKVKVASPGRLDMFAGHVPSDGDTPQPTVLRQLQEYTNQIDVSSLDGSERSMNGPRIHLSPIFPPGGTMPGFHPPENFHSVTSYTPNQKRKQLDNDDAPQKGSRLVRGTLNSMRESESEPATRNVTPVDVPRMNSVPLKRRKVFDGVHVLTFREISRWKTVQRSETSKGAINTGQDASDSQTPSRRSARGRSGIPHSTLPPSVGSDEDDLDWEDFCLDGISSDVDVDRSPVGVCPSSPPWSQAIAPHGMLESILSPPQSTGPLDSDDFPSESNLPSAMSQSGNSTSPPSLQRAKSTLSRLDALQDVYSCVANGASQIPFPELMQATRLVHQIGAVLTEQVDKQMRRHQRQTSSSQYPGDATSHP